MAANRRDFLKLAGLTVAAAGVGGVATTSTGCAPSHAQDHAPAKGTTGTRWAMVVDMREPCPEGCTACREACHVAHNVPDIDDERHEVKWIWDAHYAHVFHDQVRDVPVTEEVLHLPVPVLCNHCDNPPCVQVCPAQATYVTKGGIVAMDMHRCIGCRYCMAACPYGARSFNFMDPRIALEEKGRALDPTFPTRSMGVVEKCNFCAERVGVDPHATPACVEACAKACASRGRETVLTFGDLNDEGSDVLAKVHEGGTSIRRRRPELGTRPHVFYLV